MPKSETYLVLGANGFVGSHLVDNLAKMANSEVICFDRYSRPAVYELGPNVKEFKGDFFNKDDVDRALKGSDYVFHCFSTTTPSTSDANPYADIELLAQSVEIFESCLLNGIKKVIYISSGGAVYGQTNEVSRESDKTNPISPYGICKLAIENYLEYFKQKNGMEYVTYRLTNPYGPRQIFKNNQGAIPVFIDKIENNEPITIFGDGHASRDYIYVEDVAKMITDTFKLQNKHNIYNLGSGEQTSINDIITALKDVTGKDIQVNYKPVSKTFLQKTAISMDRYWDEFGKPSSKSLREGLVKTVESRQ